MFPVRYKLNFDIFTRKSVFKQQHICSGNVKTPPIHFNAGLLARMRYSHLEDPATGHLDTGFLGIPPSLSKCWDGFQVPSC
jgi:hypothetical protein